MANAKMTPMTMPAIAPPLSWEDELLSSSVDDEEPPPSSSSLIFVVVGVGEGAADGGVGEGVSAGARVGDSDPPVVGVIVGANDKLGTAEIAVVGDSVG